MKGYKEGGTLVHWVYDYSVMIQKLSKLLRNPIILAFKVIFHELTVRTE